MATLSRMKSDSGTRVPYSFTVTGTQAIDLPDFTNEFIADGSGTAVVSTINAGSPIRPGRVIVIRGKNGMAAQVAFTNNALTTTKGQMDLLTGLSSRSLGDNEILELQQHLNGAWSIRSTQGPSAP